MSFGSCYDVFHNASAEVFITYIKENHELDLNEILKSIRRTSGESKRLKATNENENNETEDII